MASGSIETPVGPMTLASDGRAITRVTWAREPSRAGRGASPADPLLVDALAMLRSYFAGERTTFDVPFDLGTQPASTIAVLTTLHETVEPGETITYGELAARSGTGLPARAIGSIMGSNPVPIVVPCHRVLASDGLGGYSGGERGHGLATKRWLLEHEGALPMGLFSPSP